MPAQLLLMGMFLAGSVLLCCVSLPLILGRVPRNGLYGFRTPKTLSSDSVWYPANRHAGRELLTCGLKQLVGVAAILMLWKAANLSVALVGYLGPIFLILPLLSAALASA